MSAEQKAAGSDPAPWPQAVFDAPLLRGLDARGRREIEAAGRFFTADEGTVLYRENEVCDAFFVVVSGAISLTAIRRGDAAPSVLRIAKRMDSFGEDAALFGTVRLATATVTQAAQIAELPIVVFDRVVSRSGVAHVAEREQRALRRTATRDLLRTLAFTRELSDQDLELLQDAVRFETFARGSRLFDAGERAKVLHLITDGLVQLETEEDGRIFVRAYLSRGDFFGDEEVLAEQCYGLTAVALGACRCLIVPGAVLRLLTDRNPGMLGRMRRITAVRHAQQERAVATIDSRTTQHVFKDLYRMQMARSLLAIDTDTCVRCGHCAWACASLYGVARLVRRGDKIITNLSTGAERSAPESLMLPNSCQHCRNPACLVDCPTGAIGRDPEGEVFIREELCTGCGACAKACPWDNIQMAPRQSASPTLQSIVHGSGMASSDVAVKCDLCRNYAEPACVQVCPTESIFRLDPSQEFAEVRELFGGKPAAGGAEGERRPSSMRRDILASVLTFAALGLLIVAWRLHTLGWLLPGQGVGLVAGWVSGGLCLMLGLYVVPKRKIRLWMKPRLKQSAARRAVADDETRAAPSRASSRSRSRLKPLLLLHVAAGLVATSSVALHAGPTLRASVAGALLLAFWLTAAGGVFGAVTYRFLPRWLSRLERKGALPEDLATEREQLFDRLQRQSTGKDELVKQITAKLLVAYARSFSGPLRLLFSGRSLAEEERRLRAEIDRLLQGRGAARLAGLDDLIRTVVELRALPARRALSGALRFWLPVHIVSSAILLALLVLHVFTVSRP